eukprot:TRINITY_DN101449_c0_g1_i1.p1 TRINITY_DN101449_c0_g1~~TRINITY_DN101449_c0_g1_i1.p1  ORF type:complete len:563 (+),score=107.80 TRINITY_DN101449_c0_g1_i1:124-1812(+)
MAFKGALLLSAALLSDDVAAVSLRREAHKHSSNGVRNDRMAHVLDMLKGYKDFAVSTRKEVDNRHAQEEMRLKVSVSQTSDEGVKLALEQSLTSNEESLIETERIYDNMVKFGDSLKGLIVHADKTGFGCEQTKCSLHASCSETLNGPTCICNEGYVGQGHDCQAPPDFRPYPLVFGSATGGTTDAKDLSVCVFGQNIIAAVYRDAALGDGGYVVVGSVHESGKTDISPPELFTSMQQKAFHPVIQGSQDKRILIAWRDEENSGSGWARGGALGASGIRGANFALTWGSEVSFASDQGHKMAMVAFPGSRFAVMYSAKTVATAHNAAKPFGNSMLATVDAVGTFAKLGEYRFSDFAVCRLEVTKIGPTAFVLAARAAPAVDEMDPTITTSQEAMAIYGEAVDADLVFDPNPMNLEPKGGDVWARGVSLIAPNTLAYAYQDGTNTDMKMGILKINPHSHRMTMAQEPVVVRNGFSPYVGMLNVPYTPSEPHTLMYYESGNASVINVCSWDGTKNHLGHCEDFTWISTKLSSVAGVHLGGGKSFMVFATESGKPYFTLFGLSKK